MAGVGEQRPRAGKFDGGVLARETRLEGRDAVARVWPLELLEGLDRRAVQVELGEGLPDYTFDLGDPVPPAASDAQPSIVPPDPHPGPSPDGAPGHPLAGRGPGKPPVSAPDDGWIF